jgi:mycothiol system anti-sigma-R factor
VGSDYHCTILHAYVDGELDAARAAEFERHLENCRDCTATLGAAESLRSSLQRAQLYETAPVGLREKIGAEIKTVSSPRPWWRGPGWRWAAVAAGILIVVVIGWFARPGHQDNAAPAPFTAAEMIDAHIRSLQPGHLTDVASSDRHTVKPWFDGKLDYAPPVRDFGDEDFPLVGGRLDALGGRSVAVLVYGRRKHFINVFVLPTKEPDTPIHPLGSRQGYNWLHWRLKGMEYCAVSDVSGSDLHELAQLLRQEQPESPDQSR